VDLARPVGSRTHLGRLVEQIRREGVGEFVDVIVRKVGLNLASWSSSPYRWLLPVVVAGAVLAIRIAPEVCRGAWRRLDFQGSLTVGMPVLVVLGYALNDTGVLVPVLMGMVAMATLMPLVTDPEAMAEGGRTRWTVRFGRAPASA
jgi:hypothetical protein